MKLLFAQGNPEEQYVPTRHNVGWHVLDAYAEQCSISFHSKPKFFADIAEHQIDGENILLVKPTTYYNETGRSARALIDFYKLDPIADILVLHDELALPFGTLRLRSSGSPAGNNGIKSLNAALGEQYWRLRIGIANDLLPRVGAHDFVLGKFTNNERIQLPEIIKKASVSIDAFIRDNHESTTHIVE